jgi:hypothetical protein
MTFEIRWVRALTVLVLTACSPVLNWREVRAQDSDVVALFPCKPEHFARTLTLAASEARMHLVSCSVEGVTYALGHASVREPATVNAALKQLRLAAAENIAGQLQRVSPIAVKGMTPNALAERWVMQGHGADGAVVREHVGFFTKGLRVYQATVVGPQVDNDAADVFFSGLTLSP